VRITLAGHVQGVGFRPFVYRLAIEHGIVGQVRNRLGEVDIIASGAPEVLRQFEADLVAKAPPLSRPVITGVERVEARHDAGFQIAASSSDADARIFVPPDYFMCDDCRRELQDPEDRRYRYPFINCTQCGPRYTLIESLIRRTAVSTPNPSPARPVVRRCLTSYPEQRGRCTRPPDSKRRSQHSATGGSWP
jgi:hydrogenase maturation protein HypF